jgi:hypothetical protein
LYCFRVHLLILQAALPAPPAAPLARRYSTPKNLFHQERFSASLSSPEVVPYPIVVGIALASLLAATFLVSVWASVAALPIGNILDAGNPLVRIFPATHEDATNVASANDTSLETSEDWADKDKNTENGTAAFASRAECPGPVPLRDVDIDTFAEMLLRC